MDISSCPDDKVAIMKACSGEMDAFPFRGSDDAIRTPASLRGAAADFTAAEAFILLKEYI
jgi:N-acetylglucosamine malate deacetylase 1